ncbi:MAG: hypothetical protein DRI54_04175 [Bacteroidetes bacterium]|nr:MAG: hypothetical protein DRI54_04175 [Bacteroidota bacterium]
MLKAASKGQPFFMWLKPGLFFVINLVRRLKPDGKWTRAGVLNNKVIRFNLPLEIGSGLLRLLE